jgi:hypothetical protein
MPFPIDGGFPIAAILGAGDVHRDLDRRGRIPIVLLLDLTVGVLEHAGPGDR